MQDKTYQFLEWLMGERREFPFFKEKDMPEIPMPDMRTLKERND